MTLLEVEAQNLVNEIGSQGSDVEVTDENRYEEILDARRARRTVSNCFIVRANHSTIS
jgi:hypothetical protein